MSDLEKKLSDLTPYFRKGQFLSDTYLQTVKDLAHLYNSDFVFTEKTEFSDLIDHFDPTINWLILNHRNDFVQFLYRVDLKESDIVESLGENQVELKTETLTKKILERELKKVIIRNHYSSES